VLSLFLFNGYSGYTQINLSFPQEPQHVNACEADSLNFFEITIGSNVVSVDSIYIAMPPGIDYVPGSVQVTSSSDLVLIENDLSNLSRPVFVLNREILNPGDFVAFSIARRGACEAVVFSENGMLAYDTLGVWSGVDHFVEVSTNYEVLYASMFTQYVNSNDTIVEDLTSTVCRDIQIVNGGTGYVSRIEHRVTQGS